jgi:hypothetical protein
VKGKIALAAELASGEELKRCVEILRDLGLSRFDAFTPYEVEGLQELLGVRRSRLPWIVLGAALAGGGGAYLLEWWINVVSYPLDIGGRPLHSAPAFIPITFECGVLLSALTAFFGVLAWMGYPRLYHPVFEAPGFRRASIDRFWISIEMAGDDPNALQAELKELGAEETDFVTEQLN